MPLTAVQIRNLKPTEKPYKRTDGGGLLLEVRPSGVKLWRYRYEIDGKEGLYALGEFAAPVPGETADAAKLRRQGGRYTLAEARVRHAEVRLLVKQGIHPVADRRARVAARIAADANTFAAVAGEWMAQRGTRWSESHRKQVSDIFARDVLPAIGPRPIAAITAAEILALLRRIEQRGAHATAALARQWISAAFRFAVASLRADGDPAAALRGALVRPRTQHHTPLSRSQLGEFLRALDGYGGHRTTVIALRLLLLTAVRSSELRAATWGEFDLEGAVWVIPAERMKMQTEHRVPLSRQALVLLRELRSYTGGRDLLFPNTRNPLTAMSATTLNRALERLGFNGGEVDISCHSFRGTFSTLLNELGHRADAIERQLAHADRDPVRAAYNHAQYWDERRTMMQVWADLQDSLARGATIIPITRRHAA